MDAQTIIDNAGTIVVAGGTGATGALVLIRLWSRMYRTEKRESAADIAGKSIYDTLVSENNRMSTQMAAMSSNIAALLEKNQHLSIQIADLSVQVRILQQKEFEITEHLKSIAELEEVVDMKAKKIAVLEDTLSKCERRGVII
jgi:predicted RNase H-like nuclease (RuvC/YqgF family)